MKKRTDSDPGRERFRACPNPPTCHGNDYLRQASPFTGKIHEEEDGRSAGSCGYPPKGATTGTTAAAGAKWENMSVAATAHSMNGFG